MLIRRNYPDSGQRTVLSRILILLNLSKGRKNELRALKITTALYHAGLIPHIGGLSPYLTKPYSELDRVGIDVLVPIPTSSEDGLYPVSFIGFQVKSSKEGVRKFVQRGRRFSRPEIPCIVVNDEINDATVREDIRRTCWREYYRLQERKREERT
jgi:hypothetical protein